MKLFIHTGLHKTATTSFQHFLFNNRESLLDAGVFYPHIDQNQESHWQIPNQILKNNWKFPKNYLKNAIDYAKQKNAKSVLISSEDFETILSEYFHASKLEEICFKLGYSEVHWVCVLRNQWDYFNSLYAQMAKHRTCLNYATSGEEILNFGEISMGNSMFRYKFIFDYDTILDRFLNETKGRFTALSYEDFISSSNTGEQVINSIIDSEDNKNLFWNSKLSKAKPENIRRNETDIELDYLSNFLGITMSSEIFDENKDIFIPLIQNRHAMIDFVKEDLQNKFVEKFSKISKLLE